jgi:hypothetical protein
MDPSDLPPSDCFTQVGEHLCLQCIDRLVLDREMAWTHALEKELVAYYHPVYTEEECHELDILRSARKHGIEIPIHHDHTNSESEEKVFTEEEIQKAQRKSQMKEMKKEKSKRKKANNRK